MRNITEVAAMVQQALDDYSRVLYTRPKETTILRRLMSILWAHTGLTYREVCKIYRSRHPDHVGFYDDTLKRHLRTLRQKGEAATVQPEGTQIILWHAKASK